MAISLDELAALARQFRDEREWRQFHKPKDLAAALSIEAGELQQCFLWKTEEEADAQSRSAEGRQAIADEMADVLLFLLYLSDCTGIDLGEAVRTKLLKNAARYPVGRARGNARKADRL